MIIFCIFVKSYKLKYKLMIRLLNSAMMPKVGIYKMKEIEKDNFFQHVKDAASRGELSHNIGYQQNVDIINSETGLSLVANRDRTELQDGDTILSMTLSYRSFKKGEIVNVDDFKYYITSYNEVSDNFKKFSKNLIGGSSYNFSTDEFKVHTDDLIVSLKEKAKNKFGTGYQTKISKITGIDRVVIQRAFSEKGNPTLKTIKKILDAIELKIVLK